MTAETWLGLLIAVIGSGGVGAVLGALFKPSSRAELVKAEAEAQKIVQEAVAAAMSGLQGEVERLQEKVAAQDQRIGSLESDNETCQAENRELKDQLHSLEEVLRKAGMPIPTREPSASFVVIEGKRAAVLKPLPRRTK